MKLTFREQKGNLTLGSDIPLSLYIHIPWCEKKCPYCDFNSHPLRDPIPEDDFCAQLLLDLELSLPAVWGRRLQSIFIGGGTPSLMSAAFYERLLSGIRARIPVMPFTEITLEANPGSAEAERFKGYFDAGINRLSIGVQSFSDVSLERIGRVHTSGMAHKAIEYAKSAGFKRINLDLMFALPGQSIAEATADLKQALAYDVDHLSWYQLTLEPNTAFYVNPPKGIPDSDLQADCFEAGIPLIETAGFQRYEVSAYRRENPCYHNIGYWTFGDYIGIGPGAHGKISRPDLGQIHRTVKAKHPKAYLGAPPVAEVHTIAPKQLPFEFMLNACRLVAGFDWATFESHCGLKADVLSQGCELAIENGWLKPSRERFQLTDNGLRFADSVVSLFLESP